MKFKISFSIIFSFIVFFCYTQHIYSGNKETIKNEKEQKIAEINQKSLENFKKANYLGAIELAKEALLKNPNDNIQKGRSYHYIALSYSCLGKFDFAIKNHFLSLKIKKLDKVFESWKHNMDQIDDVCVVSVKL